MPENNITISLSHYADLLDKADMLRCLQNAGVDNWEGYDFAMEEYDGQDDEGVN